MNAISLILSSLMLGLGACAPHDTGSTQIIADLRTDRARQSLPDTNSGGAFAIVELFTSEGCSSCPPADKLLSQITEEARKNGQRVFPLSFHVDYWNRLGWTDPFSDQAFSGRQSDYARAMNLNGIYTPQMIVNGRAQFVGSDAGAAREAIKSVLARTPKTTLEIQVGKPDETGAMSITYQVKNYPTGAVLNVALVERDLTVSVPRGENSGRMLHHDNVVRVFKTIAVAAEGGMRLQAPTGVRVEKSSVVAYVQDERTMEVLAAILWQRRW